MNNKSEATLNTSHQSIFFPPFLAYIIAYFWAFVKGESCFFATLCYNISYIS